MHGLARVVLLANQQVAHPRHRRCFAGAPDVSLAVGQVEGPDGVHQQVGRRHLPELELRVGAHDTERGEIGRMQVPVVVCGHDARSARTTHDKRQGGSGRPRPLAGHTFSVEGEVDRQLLARSVEMARCGVAAGFLAVRRGEQLARLITGLKDRGLLEATPDEADRRNIRLALTAEGRNVLRQLVTLLDKVKANLLAQPPAP